MTCKDCKKFKNQRTLGTCQEGITVSENPACSNFEEKPKTIFNQITASPEVLAPYLVFFSARDNGWCSMLTAGSYDTYKEAIAATVAKLKEMAENAETESL